MRRLVLDEGDGYLASQACRIVGCSYRQIDYWDRCGVITPSISPRRGSGTVSRYSADDLIRLRVARILFDGGMKADRVRQALNTLTEAAGDGQHAEYLVIADTYTAVASDQPALLEHLTADTEAITVIRVPPPDHPMTAAADVALSFFAPNRNYRTVIQTNPARP